ncbi:N-acetylneuraminate synthase family protein [bacterium]|nr:N-acetylneuraminate synthase family protein [bacterium]
MLNENKQECLIIGEIAQAHDGSLGMAHAYIDAIANAGAHAVKFQMHIADAESTIHETWRVNFSKQDKTRFDYWKRMEFREEEWIGLKKHAEECGLFFICSPFSDVAVTRLTRIGVSAWKVASGEVNNNILINQLIDTRIPIIISSGMSTITELDNTVRLIKSKSIPLAILQCTSSYPVPAEKIGLNLIQVFKQRYNCITGLSDHSGKIYPGLAAVTLGAKIIEVHVTFSKDMFGPDVRSSITMSELKQLVEGVDFIERTINNPVDKDKIAHEFSHMRYLFTKSIVTKVALSAGVTLCEKHLTIKKPGTGIPASKLKELIGRQLQNDVPADHILNESDLIAL